MIHKIQFSNFLNAINHMATIKIAVVNVSMFVKKRLTALPTKELFILYVGNVMDVAIVFRFAPNKQSLNPGGKS